MAKRGGFLSDKQRKAVMALLVQNQKRNLGFRDEVRGRTQITQDAYSFFRSKQGSRVRLGGRSYNVDLDPESDAVLLSDSDAVLARLVSSKKKKRARPMSEKEFQAQLAWLKAHEDPALRKGKKRRGKKR